MCVCVCVCVHVRVCVLERGGGWRGGGSSITCKNYLLITLSEILKKSVPSFHHQINIRYKYAGIYTII